MSSRYAISQCGSGWVIAADGAMLLICETEAIARQTVQDAEANCREAGDMRGGLNRVAEARALGSNGRKPLASTAA